MGIHYDYKSTRGMKAMEKQAKRLKKLAIQSKQTMIRINFTPPQFTNFWIDQVKISQYNEWLNSLDEFGFIEKNFLKGGPM